MTLNELYQGYYFHDSILDRIEYNSKELRMYCTFCEFLQKNDQKGEYTNSDMIVVFHNASYTITDGLPIEDSSFLTQELQDRTILFFMESVCNEYGYLKVKAESVDVIKVRSYDL